MPLRSAEIVRARFSSGAAVAVLAFLLAACGSAEEPGAPEIRPVRTVTIEKTADGEPVSITGRIEAEDLVNLSFRVGQRLLERSVNLGERVEPGQLVVRLDRATLENAVQAAQASLSGAQATGYRRAARVRAAALAARARRRSARGLRAGARGARQCATP